MKVLDALGRVITKGWCAQVDNGRGSVYAMQRYIIDVNPKGTRVILLGTAWMSDDKYKELVEAYLENPSNPDLPRYQKVPTRIIQLKEPLN